ncbi:MAG: Gfo/Idh/MocA family oxidoreductase [Planctomycetaceae bacterium]|nr:Gfo/Idh/MocA family oxidoreductase [Planctomycetaceae bacterium]
MYKPSRREFLEQSMLAATAALTVGPSFARAAEGSSDPSEIIKVCCIGVRGRGDGHVSEYLARKDCEITAVVDVDDGVAEKSADKIRNKSGRTPKIYKDMREAFDDKSINLVSIATPNHWHALAAIWAIQAGKDVYVEKPVSHNVSEGRRIVEAARKHKKIVQTGTQCRSSKATRDAIAYIQAGEIGEVKLARGLCYKPRGSIGPKGNYEIPANVDYDLWCGPAPVKPLTRKNLHYDWHWIWDTGNGDLGNQGIHQMDVARWGLGVEGLGDSVQSYGGRLGYIDAGETANSQVSVHKFGDKTLIFETRGLKTDDLRGARVGNIFYGTKGYVVMSGYDKGAAFDLDGKMVKEFKGSGDHFGNCIEAVRSRKHTDLHADIEEGHRSSALCHLGNISYLLGEQMTVKEAGSSIKGKDELESYETFGKYLTGNGLALDSTKIGFGPVLTLKGEVFEGTKAKEANPMLTREYRKPFVVPKSEDV